ncbi:homeobox-leucine zipper protein MERISTEM L1 isoform X3 [Gossypium hirsutum]|uniref:Homeobox-leucine zipper protein MERISTEM L1 isoform X3 n=1 Tax=Gossypium hirsutum TaxID=3635 RepID=A0ABM3C054_GOSHI|nr:homeobox-leucine zipper protein MERISTEM L1-like isoform X3 [Gossypium hirsutum]
MNVKPFPGPSCIRLYADDDDDRDFVDEGFAEKKGKDKDQTIPRRDLSVAFKTYKRQLSNYQRLQLANNYCKAAYLEVMSLAKEAGTWVRAKPRLGNLDDLVNEFRTPPLPGRKMEVSVATAVIPDVLASEIAEMMTLSSNLWSKLLFPLVKYVEGSNVVGSLQYLSYADVSIKAAVQMYAELQLPTTLVPTRYFEFLRYGKEIMDGIYIIVDVSSRYSDPFAKRNSERRPSGVIIREHGPEDCEIIWIENVEVDETRENLYSTIIGSNLAYGAHRWVTTLLWNLKRDKSSFSDLKIDVHPGAGSFLLALTQAMKRFFMECVSQHPDETALTVITSGEDPIRILHNKKLNEYISFVGVNSFRVQAKPLSVFQFLMKKDLQLEQFRVFGDSETNEVDEEPELLFTFGTDDKSNIISLHKRVTKEGIVYGLQEASMDEYCSFILSKTLTEDTVNAHIVCGNKSIYEDSKSRMANITPSGFAIMPDGPGGLHCDASLVTFLVQLYYDPLGNPVDVEFVRKDFLSDLNSIIRELNEKVVGEKTNGIEIIHLTQGKASCI